MKTKQWLSALCLLLAGAPATATASPVAAEEPFETWHTYPSAGAEVKQLRGIQLLYMWDDPEASIEVNSDLLYDVRIINGDGDYASTEVEVGEPSMIMNDMVLMVPLMFDAQIRAGEYTVELPRGLFYQTKYNEETDTFGPFPGYQESAAETLTFTVDPETPGILDDYTLLPETEGSVISLDDVKLTFNNFPYYLTLNMLGFDDITLTQGDTTFIGVARNPYPYMNNEFSISFVDDQGEPAALGGGVWKLTIPEGYFMFDGNQSPEIVREYNICPVVLYPAEGSTLNEITYFEVSFPGAIKAEYVGAGYMITLTKGQASGIPYFDVEEIDGAGAPTFRLTPIEGFAEPGLGWMSLNIEEGAFLVDGVESPRITAQYNYERPIEQTYTPEPNLQEVLCRDWGYTVGFVFDAIVSPYLVAPDQVTVTFDDTVLKMGSEIQCYDGQADYSWNTMENILSFFIANPAYQKEGTLTVTLPGSAYTLSGEPGFDISHTWQVVMPKEYEVTITPDGGEAEGDATVVGALDEITLVFENAENVEVFQPSGISLRKTDYSVYMTGEIEAVENAEHPTFSLKFTPSYGEELTDGLYKLQIRYDTFTLDGVQTWPADYIDVERFYNLDKTTGVSSVEAAGNVVTVVATDGRVVLKNASAESMNGLDKGVYIVNGKKVVISK